jgi:GWxTD domain-containing protein
MNVLESFVASPLAGAIGWALLHSLWEGAVISGALGAALVALRSPRSRYIAACAAMLAMLAAFGFTLARMMPEGGHSTTALIASALPAWNVAAAKSPSIIWETRLALIVPYLAPFWILGVLLVYVRRLAGFVPVHKLRRRGVCCTSEHWQKELARLKAHWRIPRPVKLLESCLADVPMVLGHFRPLILVPAGLLAGLPPGQIEAILLHELAHIRRHDYLVNVFQRFVEGLFFYNPAAWWFSRLIRAEREKCCDDAAVDVLGEPYEYAKALSALEQNRRTASERAVAVTGGNLVERIRRLLYPKPNNALAPFLATIILIATAVVSLAAWQSNPHDHTPASSQSQANPALSPDPYLKWISGPVSYIITPQEKAHFLRLKRDSERQEFIQQFWERRNPNPGSSENVSEVEFYRRVAYANQHFSFVGVAGWKTDRGRIYIMYGPPDEMNDYSKGFHSPYAVDVWHYGYIPGIGRNVQFTFTDRTGNGDFRIASAPPIIRTIEYKGLTVPAAIISRRMEQIGLGVMQPYDQKKINEASEVIQEICKQRGIAGTLEEVDERIISPGSIALTFVISKQ